MSAPRRIWIGRDLPPIHRGDDEYFLVGVDDELFLVLNRCPHRGGPLKHGWLNEREQLVCPMHGGVFPLDVLLRRPSTRRLHERPAGAGDVAE